MFKIRYHQAAVSLFLLSLLTCCALLAQPAAEPVPLLGHWAMEPGQPGALLDAGAGKLDGAARNVDSVPGKTGQALQMRPDSDVNTGNTATINRAGAQLTISMWIKADAYPANGQGAGLLAKRGMNVAAPFIVSLGHNGELGFEGNNGVDWSSNLFSGPNVVPLRQWAHLAVTFKSNDKLHFYVNGKPVAEKSVSRALASNDQPLVFGRDAMRGAFSGQMDEVKLYAVALSPAQVQADMNGTLRTRAVSDADFPPPTHLVQAALVRWDMPMGFSEGWGRTRFTAQRASGPDAIDWPAITWKGQPVFDKSGEQGLDVLLRDGAEARPLFQQPGDEVLQPGGHWFRPLQWLWGQRFVYTNDRTARTFHNDYELWTFPVLIKGAGEADVKDVLLSYDGKTIYQNAGPLRSLTLLLPQNEKGKPYQLSVAGRGPLAFEAGLQPIVPGNPRHEIIKISATLPGAGPKITLQNLERPQSFPAQKEWDADVGRMQVLLATTRTTDVLKARRNEAAQALAAGAPAAPPLVAFYAMEPDKAEPQRLVDLGPLGLDGQLLEGAVFTAAGHKDNALQLNGGSARVEVKAAALDKLSGEFSVTLWVRLDQLPPGGSVAAIVSKRRSVYVPAPFTLNVNESGALNVSSYDGARWNVTPWSGPLLKPGQWMHLALTMKKGGEAVLYADGNAIARTALGDIATNNEPLLLGYEEGADFQGGGRSGLQGALDEVKVYAAALSPAQVQADMNGTLPARAPAGAVRQPRQTLASAPVTGATQPTSLTRYLGIEVPRSPLTINGVDLPHGMSGGFYYDGLHTPEKNAGGGGNFRGTVEEYAAYLAGTGYDRSFEFASSGALTDASAPDSRDAMAQALARHGLQLGITPDVTWKLPFLTHPNLAFFSHNLPDYHAPLYRDLQLAMQHLNRYGNLAGVSIGADNGAYVSFWDWAPPEPGRPWAEAFANWTGGKTGWPEAKSVGGQASTREFVDYIGRYNQTFEQYGYFSRAVNEVSPRLMMTSGSFGSSPGVGARGGWPWASVPGREIFAGTDVQQAYDWDEQNASKPLHNVALTDRLRSYHPHKTTWALLDNFFIKFGREARQRAYALALTRGVQAVGSNWLALPSGPFARPQAVAEQKELYGWIHKYGGAYASTEPDAAIGVLFVQPQALLRRANQKGNDAGDEDLLSGSHEGKTTEALFLCHAAGWPAKIITPDEVRRGLPASMKAILLVGLNTFDDTWHWYDDLQAQLQKFTAGGGRLLLDHESAVPAGVTASKTGLAVRSYIVNDDRDQTPRLFARNAGNIAKLRAAMNGIAAPVAASSEPTIWAIPHRTGDVQYVTVVNQGYEEGKDASKFVKPQTGALAWNTRRPIYDVRSARKLSAGQAAAVDLTKDGFQLYALPSGAITAPRITVAKGAEDFYSATVTIGAAQGMAGVPLQLTISKGAETATIYGASGAPVKLPIRTGDAGSYTVTATELLSNLSGKMTVKVAPAPFPARSRQAASAALARFAARKDVPLVVALTPEQAIDPKIKALAMRLAQYFRARGRTVSIERIEPNGVVLSLQPLRGMQHFPQWKTIDADLVLLGTPLNNVLLLDQERGLLLPDAAPRRAGPSSVVVTYSPFVGERNALNIIAGDEAGLTSAINAVEQARG